MMEAPPAKFRAVLFMVNTEGLGDKPLTVGSAEDHERSMMADSKAEAMRVEQAAQDLQEELTNLSSNSTRRVIEGPYTCEGL
jgi:hypothetical protein